MFRRKHPSDAWPPPGAAPSIDLARNAAGPMRLGDPLESARVFGKPERVSKVVSGEILEYRDFDLEFGKDGRLVCIQFYLDDEDSVTIGEYRLTPATQPLDARVWFGDPTSDSKDGDLRWIDFEREGATLALEFDLDKLRCVQLYAPGYG
jgi:hypothetical protein